MGCEVLRKHGVVTEKRTISYTMYTMVNRPNAHLWDILMQLFVCINL